jgi:phage shock protein C
VWAHLKKLYRSKKERIIAGVCGGIAEYAEIDVTLIRLIWALSVLFGGFGILAYLIAWVIIPKKK